MFNSMFIVRRADIGCSTIAKALQYDVPMPIFRSSGTIWNIRMTTKSAGELRTAGNTQARPSIQGSVNVDTVSLNAKGGSLAAVLKQSIRGDLRGGEAAFAANIPFSNGSSAVLIAPALGHSPLDRPFSIFEISKDKYIIQFEGDTDVLDPFTRASLAMIESKAEQGKLRTGDIAAFERSIAESEKTFGPIVQKILKKAAARSPK